jgi:hypothetical protein
VPTDTVASQKAMGDHGHKGTGRHNPADTGTPEVPHGEHHHPHSPIADKLYTWAWLRWDSLAADGNRRRVPGTALFAAIGLLVGLIASVWTTHSGINLAYADAQSHLTIARRVFDSKAPGFEQLGTVWLPVPHLLLMRQPVPHQCPVELLPNCTSRGTRCVSVLPQLVVCLHHSPHRTGPHCLHVGLFRWAGRLVHQHPKTIRRRARSLCGYSGRSCGAVPI